MSQPPVVGTGGGGGGGWAALANIAASFLTPDNVSALSQFIAGKAGTDGLMFGKGGKKGSRGVILLDVSTGLVIGRTSRASALAHLAGKRSAKRRGRTRTIIVTEGGARDVKTTGTTTVVR